MQTNYSPEYIKGALAALSEVQAVGLSMAMIASVVLGKETGSAVNSVIKDSTNALIEKYKAMVVKND